MHPTSTSVGKWNIRMFDSKVKQSRTSGEEKGKETLELAQSAQEHFSRLQHWNKCAHSCAVVSKHLQGHDQDPSTGFTSKQYK